VLNIKKDYKSVLRLVGFNKSVPTLKTLANVSETFMVYPLHFLSPQKNANQF
jgi:hypothetical protein